eukprot:scaffold11352_cov114-Isochrysis_galbana.AAC.6
MHRVEKNNACVWIFKRVCVVEGEEGVERHGHRLSPAARVAREEVGHGWLSLVKRDHGHDGPLAGDPVQRTPHRIPSALAPRGRRGNDDVPVVCDQKVVVQSEAGYLVLLPWGAQLEGPRKKVPKAYSRHSSGRVAEKGKVGFAALRRVARVGREAVGGASAHHPVHVPLGHGGERERVEDVRARAFPQRQKLAPVPHHPCVGQVLEVGAALAERERVAELSRVDALAGRALLHGAVGRHVPLPHHGFAGTAVERHGAHHSVGVERVADLPAITANKARMAVPIVRAHQIARQIRACNLTGFHLCAVPISAEVSVVVPCGVDRQRAVRDRRGGYHGRRRHPRHRPTANDQGHGRGGCKRKHAA